MVQPPNLHGGGMSMPGGDDMIYYKVSKSIWVDTSMEEFTLTIKADPIEALADFSLVMPAGHTCDERFIDITSNQAEDSRTIKVVFKDCPCTGEWKLVAPEPDSYSYNLKSRGEYVVSFDAYFVDETSSSSQVANYAPCSGKDEYLVVNLLQGEKVNKATLTAKILGVSGNTVHWSGALSDSYLGGNKFAAKVDIPTGLQDGFRVMLEGEIIDGSKFQRVSTRYYYPTQSCLRIIDVAKYYTITPNSKTFIEMELTNNGQVKESFTIVCTNNKEYSAMVGGKSNPVYLKPGQTTKVKGYISGPKRGLKEGSVVLVTCIATTSTGQLVENIRLTEFERDLDCKPTRKNKYCR